MKRVLLCPNMSRDRGLTLTRAVYGLISDRGVEAVVCPLFDDGRAPAILPGVAVCELEDELGRADLIITFGVDGTILRTARAAAPYDVPILGVNLGNKGFMAELERGEIDRIPEIVSGGYELDRRMMLDVELFRDGLSIYSDFALNDVVIAGKTKVIDLTLYGDGQKITRFSGDGAVVATPTGSTAYSMAAGGPIVEPSADNIIMTPICAHVLAARSFVLASDRRVSVALGTAKTNPAYLSVDGGVYLNLTGGDTVKIAKSRRETLLVRLSDRSFYKKVSEKLGERFEK